MKVILDTNILVSMLLSRHGTLEALKRAWRERLFETLISDDLLRELRDVLTRPHLAGLTTPEEREEFLDETMELGVMVTPARPYPPFVDNKDSFLLAMIRDARPDALITGDRALLELGVFKDVPIVSAREYVNLLADDT